MLTNETGTENSVTTTGAPTSGTVIVDADGSLIYSPAAGFAGTATFTYTVTDGFGRSDTATVTVTVVPPSALNAVDDAYTTPFRTDLTVVTPGVLGNDTGTGMTVTGETDPPHAS